MILSVHRVVSFLYATNILYGRSRFLELIYTFQIRFWRGVECRIVRRVRSWFLLFVMLVCIVLALLSGVVCGGSKGFEWNGMEWSIAKGDSRITPCRRASDLDVTGKWIVSTHLQSSQAA